MFTSLKVSGYRGLKSVEIERLGRVNLVAGRNNSGKTSLLEAVFLLSHGGSAHAALNRNVLRSGFTAGPGDADDVWGFWGPLFSDLDLSRPVTISGRHATHGSIRLKIEHRYSGRVGRASESPDTRPGIRGSPELHFALTVPDHNGQPARTVRSRASFVDEGADVETRGDPLSARCVILKSGADHPQNDAWRLGSATCSEASRDCPWKCCKSSSPDCGRWTGSPAPGDTRCGGISGFPSRSRSRCWVTE